MKVLQINNVYKKGSTGKITYDIHSELLNRGIESVVCYGRREKVIEENVYKTCSEFEGKYNNILSRITGVRYGGCFLATKRLIHIIEKEKPDIVHLQCINGHFVNIYKLVRWLNDHSIKTVLTLHAEFMYTANCSHAYECDKWTSGCGNCPRVKDATKTFFADNTKKSYKKMQEAFCDFKDLTIISVSSWLKERAEKSLILQNMNHKVIYNGVDTSVFQRIPSNDAHYEKTVFHVTPFFTDQEEHNKGGKYVLELAKRMENIQFLVAGNYSISGKIPSNVQLLGEVKDQKILAKYYSLADVTLLTSKRETFSMVCAESLCCGTPVVGFEAGAPETISIKEYSRFVKYANLEEMERVLLDFLYKIKFDNYKISKQACKLYSKENMCELYMQEYRRLL